MAQNAHSSLVSKHALRLVRELAKRMVRYAQGSKDSASPVCSEKLHDGGLSSRLPFPLEWRQGISAFLLSGSSPSRWYFSCCSLWYRERLRLFLSVCSFLSFYLSISNRFVGGLCVPLCEVGIAAPTVVHVVGYACMLLARVLSRSDSCSVSEVSQGLRIFFFSGFEFM